MAILALDLDSIGLTCAALGSTGKILKQVNTNISEKAGSEISIVIQENISIILDEYKTKPMRIKSGGISVPGIYYPQNGRVWAPNISGWDDYPLKDDLLGIIREYNIRIRIASKRTCNILGESWLGAAKGLKNAIYFSVSNGIGAGVLVDGKVLHGFNDGVGAVGWLSLNSSYNEIYKEKGFFEYLASGRGMINLTNETVDKNRDYAGLLKTLPQEDLKKSVDIIFEAYFNKDPVATKVVKKCVDYWGIAIANLINLFDPEKIIFGGVVFGPALELLDKIKKESEKWAHPQFIEKVKLVPSKLKNNSALFGAGYLVNKKF